MSSMSPDGSLKRTTSRLSACTESLANGGRGTKSLSSNFSLKKIEDFDFVTSVDFSTAPMFTISSFSVFSYVVKCSRLAVKLFTFCRCGIVFVNLSVGAWGKLLELSRLFFTNFSDSVSRNQLIMGGLVRLKSSAFDVDGSPSMCARRGSAKFSTLSLSLRFWWMMRILQRKFKRWTRLMRIFDLYFLFS